MTDTPDPVTEAKALLLLAAWLEADAALLNLTDRSKFQVATDAVWLAEADLKALDPAALRAAHSALLARLEAAEGALGRVTAHRDGMLAEAAEARKQAGRDSEVLYATELEYYAGGITQALTGEEPQ